MERRTRNIIFVFFTFWWFRTGKMWFLRDFITWFLRDFCDFPYDHMTAIRAYMYFVHMILCVFMCFLCHFLWHFHGFGDPVNRVTHYTLHMACLNITVCGPVMCLRMTFTALVVKRSCFMSYLCHIYHYSKYYSTLNTCFVWFKNTYFMTFCHIMV